MACARMRQGGTMEKLIAYAPLLAQGAVVTITLALASLLLAVAFGVMGAVAKLSGGVVSRGVAAGYTTLVRGVPDLVLILLFYFGGQRLINDIGGMFGRPYIGLSEFWAGVGAIGFIYGAYLTETFRGAYLTIPRGQTEAARALGMKPGAILRTVLAPQILRFALPGFGNVWMVLVKSTAVVSVIGLQDLVGLADKAAKTTREPFLFFLAVIVVYLVITSASNWALARVGDRVNRGQTA
jgi:His/Glu/Gln/Arg/opine family amino acid ABC transporter permease subunit